MLYIESDEETVLPVRYRPANNICAVVYDLLAEISISEIYKPFSVTTVQFPEGENIQDAFDKEKEHIIDYLGKNNYKNELTDILTKHVTLSVLSDLLHFIYESLSCAKKGKMTVAYSLLRKPFKDELFLLESLLVDRDKFVNQLFFDGRPRVYDPSKKSSAERKNLIEEAVKLTENYLFSSNILYEFRYDKDSVVGISGFSEHAIHIVTTNKGYETDPQNLNFVFSRPEDIERYWEHYYFIVPYLLLYTSSVVDAIIFKSLTDDDAIILQFRKSIKRLAGQLLWFKKCSFFGYEFPKNLVEDIGKILKISCANCTNPFYLDDADFELFFFTDEIICPHCFCPNSIENLA